MLLRNRFSRAPLFLVQLVKQDALALLNWSARKISALRGRQLHLETGKDNILSSHSTQSVSVSAIISA